MDLSAQHEISHLREKIRELSLENDRLHNERAAIRQAVIKMADTLGFTGEEEPGQIGKKLIGMIPKYLAMYQLSPEKFKEKFAFMGELMPLIKDFIKD